MMQIRIMGHAGVMAGIHGSTLPLLSSFCGRRSATDFVPVCDAFEFSKLNKQVIVYFGENEAWN